MANRNEQLIGQLNLAAHFHDLIGHQMSDLGVSLPELKHWNRVSIEAKQIFFQQLIVL